MFFTASVRHWWLLVTAALCSVTIALAASSGHKPIYRAEVNVAFDDNTLFYAFVGLDNQIAFGGAEERAPLARDPEVIREALRRIGPPVRSGASILDASSAAALRDNSSTIGLSIEDADPSLAVRIATAYAHAFARASWSRYRDTADRVLPQLKARIRNSRSSRAVPPAVIRSLARQATLLEQLRQNSPVAVKPTNPAAHVWPRPVVSSLLAATLTIAFTLGLAVVAALIATRMRRLSSFGLVAVSLVGATAIGWEAVWIEGKPARAMGMIAIALIPPLAALAATALPLLASFVVFAQVFEGYEFNTPVGTLSPGSVALLVLILWSLPQFASLLRSTVTLIFAAIIGVLVGAHTLQFLHLAPSAAMRDLVTVGGLALFWLAGIYFARQPWGMTAAGIGAALALCLLGTAALGVAAHLLPQTNLISVGRTFFGFHSPLPRTYGLRVGSLPSLFLPLAVPWLTLVILDGRKLVDRVAAGVFLAVLLTFILLSFQSRSMLMQICVGIVITLFTFRARWWRIVLGTLALVLIATVAVPSLLFTTDRLSTANRWDAYKLAGHFFGTHLDAIFLGTNAQTLVHYINAHLVPPQPADAPIHDTFLQFLAQGGMFAALAAGALLLSPLGVWILVVRRGHPPNRASAWLPAVGAMLAIDMVSFALVVDAGNGWLALGMISGYASALWSNGSHESPASAADQTWRDPQPLQSNVQT